MGAFLHHAPKSTARAHYAIGFPLDCVVGIAGCENLEGKDYDRISGLLGAKLRASRLMLEGPLLQPSSHVPEYPTLVYSTLPPWFKKWHLRLLLSNETCITNNQRRFMDDLYELMAQFVEAAARFRIDSDHQEYVFYGYPPFNIRGGEFDKFVVALANAIEARRPERENLRRTHRFLEVGSVGEAMNSAAKSQISANGVKLRENNAAVASEVVSQLLPMLGSFVGVACGSDAAAKFTSSVSAAMSSGISHAGTSGRGTPGAQAAAAPSPRSQINMKDPSTWPEDPSWIVNRQPKLSLNKNPRCLRDLYTEWNNGHLNWPALRDLEEKYPRGTWRPRRANFSQQVGRIRIYNKFMPTPAVQTLQDELYAYFQLSTAEEKGDVRWSQMRQFCDSVLRPRNEGFKKRSDERKRRKVVQMERAKAMTTSAAGGKSNGE